MQLAFFGTADFSYDSLAALLEAGYQAAVVVTKPDSPGKRGRQLLPPAVKPLAQNHGIPLLQPRTQAEAIEQLRPFAGISWAVVVAYGMIIPPDIIEQFEGNMLNVHASLLPRWRGPSPIEAAILHGDRKTGNSLMKLTASMDTGPIYAQTEYSITSETNRLSLHEDLKRDGAELLVQKLPDILTGRLEPATQDESQATYSSLLTKSDGVIDWQQPAAMIERQIRAYLGWPGSTAHILETPVTIEAARTIERSGTAGAADTVDGQLVVFCGEQALVIEQLTPTGRRSMSGREFLRGYAA